MLRDYLAEFVAFVFLPRFGLNMQKVTRMDGLKKYMLDGVTGSDTLLDGLKVSMDHGGWIQPLGSYRDLVIHSVPLAQAESKLFAVCDAVTISEGRNLPAVVCPIPEKPGEIRAARVKGNHFEDFETQLGSFVQAAKGEIRKCDSMQYAHQVLEKLSELASEIAEVSPMPPQTIVLDGTDIIRLPVIKDISG